MIQCSRFLSDKEGTFELQNHIVIAFSIAEVLLECSNYFAEVGREGKEIADTSGTVQLNKKLSLPLTNYRPQHTLQGFEACLWLRGKCAVLGLAYL